MSQKSAYASRYTEIKQCLIKVNATYESVNLRGRFFKKVHGHFIIVVRGSGFHGFHNGGCIPVNVITHDELLYHHSNLNLTNLRYIAELSMKATNALLKLSGEL